MIRCRFRTASEDPRPVKWPVRHPYWVTGEGNGYSTLVAYADDEAEILQNWPEATHLDSEPATEYAFSGRFPKPEWFEPDATHPTSDQLRDAAPCLAAALTLLVTLKDAKDSDFTGEITEAEYRRRKPLAWAEAHAALHEAGMEP